MGESDRTLGDKRETRPRSQRHSIWPLTAETERAGDTTPQPASQRLASDRRASVTASGIQIQGNKGDATPKPASQHLWHPDTGRQAGDATPTEPASQHLASDRRDSETQASGRHETGTSANSVWHLTAETGRRRETSGRHDPGAGVTAFDRRDWETSGRHDPAATVTASGI